MTAINTAGFMSRIDLLQVVQSAGDACIPAAR
jgi:hypothetical protein